MDKKIESIQTQMNGMVSSLSKNVNELKHKIPENKVWINKKRPDTFTLTPKRNTIKKTNTYNTKRFTFEWLKYSTYYIKPENTEDSVKVGGKEFLQNFTNYLASELKKYKEDIRIIHSIYLSFGGIKFCTSQSVLIEELLYLGEWGTWRNINLNKIFQPRIVIHNVSVKTSIAEVKDKIAEDLSYSNLLDQTFDIRRIYKKTNSRDRTGSVYTQSNSIRLIAEEQVIKYIMKKGYITLDYKAHPISEFHLKNKKN